MRKSVPATRFASPQTRNQAVIDVIVVDDNREFAEYVATAAELNDLKTEVITDPSLFVARFQASKPGIVVLDINMPGTSGMQLAQWLGEHTRASQTSVALVIISGEGEEALHVCQAVGQITGLDNVVALSKPVEYAVLAQVFKDATGRSD